MLAGRCRQHPLRDAVGVCMRCRAALCVECTTRLDGVNHCHACLDALRRQAGQQGVAAPSGAGRATLAVALYGAVFVLLLTLDALVRSGR